MNALHWFWFKFWKIRYEPELIVYRGFIHKSDDDEVRQRLQDGTWGFDPRRKTW